MCFQDFMVHHWDWLCGSFLWTEQLTPAFSLHVMTIHTCIEILQVEHHPIGRMLDHGACRASGLTPVITTCWNPPHNTLPMITGATRITLVRPKRIHCGVHRPGPARVSGKSQQLVLALTPNCLDRPRPQCVPLRNRGFIHGSDFGQW